VNAEKIFSSLWYLWSRNGFEWHDLGMENSRETLHDKALAGLKLSFQIIEEIQRQENKSKLSIFENSLRFTFQDLTRTLFSLNEIAPDPALLEKSFFLTPSPISFDIPEVQPKLLSLQKYLLATLL